MTKLFTTGWFLVLGLAVFSAIAWILLTPNTAGPDSENMGLVAATKNGSARAPEHRQRPDHVGSGGTTLSTVVGISSSEPVLQQRLPASGDSGREASIAYHGAVHCWEHVLAQKKATKMPEPSDVHSPAAAEALAKELDAMGEALRAYQDECRGVSYEQAGRTLADASLQAGKVGNLAAQSCFIHNGVSFLGSNGQRDAREARYLAYAPTFMANGIDAAYWPIVSVAVPILLDVSGLPDLWSALPRPDPYKVYRALRLMYYRSDSAGAANLERNMDALESRYGFSAQALAEADRWARDVYRESYADSAPLDSKTAPFCQ